MINRKGRANFLAWPILAVVAGESRIVTQLRRCVERTFWVDILGAALREVLAAEGKGAVDIDVRVRPERWTQREGTSSS